MTTSLALKVPPVINSFSKITTFQRIQGQILHPNGDALADQKIAFFSPGWFKNHLIAQTVTDKFGKFFINYNWKHRGFEKHHDILLQVFEETIPSEIHISERITDTIPFTIPIQPNLYDIGKISSKLYEAQKDFPGLEVVHGPTRPQQDTTEFKSRLLFGAISHKLQSLIATVVSVVSIEAAQKLFGTKNPDLKATPENTVEFILNGLYPGHFRKGKDANEFVNHINWDKYDKDPSPDLPNVSLTLKKVEGSLVVKEVAVKYPHEEMKSYAQKSPGFENALYLFNSMALIKGEAVHHLGIGHLMTGQLALSFFRHVKKHPIRKLLLPHLDGVAEINRLGAGLIFGEKGVLNISGLNPKGIHQVLADALNSFDFITFKPRESIVPGHRFAKAQQLYWQLITEVVDQFFHEHASEITSAETWHELFYLSKHLVKHSLPYSSFEGGEDQMEWTDRSELDQPEIPGRVVVDGKLRAIRPFISSLDTPIDQDIENLKQFCRFTLFLSTFYHWALHSSQGKWGTNLAFGSLAPENHAKDKWGGTRLINAAKQLEVASVLADFEVPALVQNPYGKIYQPLIDKLIAHKEDFNKLGYAIENMHYGVVI